MQRRQLFHAAGAFSLAAAAAAANDTTGAAVVNSDAMEQLAAPGRADLGTVDLVRSTLYTAMQLDDQMGSPAAIRLVSAQQAFTEDLLRDCADDLRPALQSLHAEFLGFRGCLAWDAGDYVEAAGLYDLAYETAHAAEDDDLAAYMLCHLSQLAIWQQRRRRAIDHAVAARSWVSDSDDARLSAYVGLRMAEAAALNRQHKEALSALDDAERHLSGLEVCHPSQSRAYFVGSGLLESYRGNVLALLGDNVSAIAASKHAADLMGGPYTRDRAVTLLELSRPLIQLGEIDEAASVIGDAADITERNRSPRLAASVVTARHSLAPWATAPAVTELDARLIDRDIVTA